MCGIYGIIDFQKKLDLEVSLNLMGSSMKHRGPDNRSSQIQNNPLFNIGLGHNRLAIIDLSESANQPFKFQNLTLVFNGEIYNYKEIRKELVSIGYHFNTDSDTEVVIKAFDSWGINSIKRFIGMFAFCIYDSKKESCFIIRDRIGVKPLYYYMDDNQFCFGSELKSLMVLENINKKINHNALAQFFSLGYISRENCIIENTNKLEPGKFLQFDLKKKQLIKETYWEAKSFFKPTDQIPIIKENQYKEELKTLFKSAIDYRLISDVPVGILLSGGYDSSLVTSNVTESKMDVKTFTVGFEDPKYDESEYAEQISKYLGTEHHMLKCNIDDAKKIIPELPFIYDEPFGDYSSIPTLLISKFVKDHVKVVLSADGGDENFGGYNKYSNALRNFSKLEKIPSLLRNLSSNVLNTHKRTISKILSSSYRIEHKIHTISEYLKQNGDISILNELISQRTNKLELKLLFKKDVSFEMYSNSEKDEISEISNLSKLIVSDYNYYLPDDILVKVERATMANSIEGRVPLLDHRIIEFAAKMPDSLKINDGNKKYILKDILHEKIPKELLDRPKKGFGVPLHNWFREDLISYLYDYILDINIEEQGLFNEQYVKTRVNNYIDGSYNDWDFTWHMLVFQMWYSTWIKK